STLLRHWTAPNLDTSLRTVLEQKGDPSCASGAGWTPLILCAMADRGDLCQLLLQFGADPFQAGPRGRSALLWADWYQASKALAVLKAEKREKRDDREGLKRLQQGLKDDELASPIVTPLPADELVAAMNFPGLSFAELVEHQLQRQAEVWETSTSSGPSNWASSDWREQRPGELDLTPRSAGKLWAVGEEPEGDANSTESLQEILNQVDLGPVGHFDSMKSLVAAARLLVQAKIAGGDTTTSSRRVNRPEDRLGAPADSANGALALYVLTLLDAKARERINQKWQSEVWAKTLLSSSGLAWQQLPAERSVVFRAVRLEGDLSSYRRPLELFAPRRPVSWPCPSYGTLDRRVAMAYLEDWKDAAGRRRKNGGPPHQGQFHS
ncbi:ANK_REP_REGION domain-containing protein, partial [Durusdinium trenchii]